MMKMSRYFSISGKSQAENEQDTAAISALRKCLSLDPSNGAAWMALSVCFTNESYQAQACHALAMWIQTHPQYSDLLPATLHSPTPENFKFTSSFMSSELHEETVDLFLRAARTRATTPGSSTLDPDVQVKHPKNSGIVHAKINIIWTIFVRHATSRDDLNSGWDKNVITTITRQIHDQMNMQNQM